MKLSSLLQLQNWRAASTFVRAFLAYDKGRYSAALTLWERLVELERTRASEFMAFYAVLMVMNNRPAEEGLAMFQRVASGEFHRDRPASRYAEALAHYWVSFLLDRPDVLEQWLNASKLKPASGWVPQLLALPDNPIDPAGLLRHPTIAR